MQTDLFGSDAYGTPIPNRPAEMPETILGRKVVINPSIGPGFDLTDALRKGRDWLPGEAELDLALARVQVAAPAGWMESALEAIRNMRGQRREITTDDLWELLPMPPEPRLMGAAVRQAALAGLLRKTDRVRPSVRPECHRRPVAIWEVVG